MLAILYITSAIASFLTPIYEERECYQSSLVTGAVAIITGIVYSICMISELLENIFEPYFWTVFGLLSLIFLIYAFLTNDHAYLLDYMVAAFLGSGVLCFLLSNVYFNNYLIICNQNHDYTEHVEIVTTIDGSEYGESIYGEGFVIATITNSNSSKALYQYYFVDESGNLEVNEVRENRTQITFTDSGSLPFVEIHHTVDCSGYRNRSKTHVFRSTRETYHFYIPQDSVANISSNSN